MSETSLRGRSNALVKSSSKPTEMVHRGEVTIYKKKFSSSFCCMMLSLPATFLDIETRFVAKPLYKKSEPYSWIFYFDSKRNCNWNQVLICDFFYLILNKIPAQTVFHSNIIFGFFTKNAAFCQTVVCGPWIDGKSTIIQGNLQTTRPRRAKSHHMPRQSKNRLLS